MIHFYMTLSGNKQLEFQAELFLRSLDMCGRVKYCLTVCQAPGEEITNHYVKQIAEVVTRPKSDFAPEWYACLGCVPQKGDVTIYTDADIMILDDISQIERKCLKYNAVCGVQAYATPSNYGHVNWRTLYHGCGVEWPGEHYEYSVEEGKCPFYPNLGFVAVPSVHVPKFNTNMIHYLRLSNRIYPNHYHRPQLAMSLSTVASGLCKYPLSLRYNYPDLFNFLEKDADKAAVVHLLKTKSEVRDWSELREFIKKPPRNKVVERIQDRMKKIAKVMSV